jgi:hypothetical protein
MLCSLRRCSAAGVPRYVPSQDLKQQLCVFRHGSASLLDILSTVSLMFLGLLGARRGWMQMTAAADHLASCVDLVVARHADMATACSLCSPHRSDNPETRTSKSHETRLGTYQQHGQGAPPTHISCTLQQYCPTMPGTTGTCQPDGCPRHSVTTAAICLLGPEGQTALMLAACWFPCRPRQRQQRPWRLCLGDAAQAACMADAAL